MGFWAAMGVSGFRVDAAPFVIAAKGADADKHPHESYEFDHFVYLFEERENERVSDGKIELKLPPRGFSWLRLVTA
jgi:glycosidase